MSLLRVHAYTAGSSRARLPPHYKRPVQRYATGVRFVCVRRARHDVPNNDECRGRGSRGPRAKTARGETRPWEPTWSRPAIGVCVCGGWGGRVYARARDRDLSCAKGCRGARVVGSRDRFRGRRTGGEGKTKAARNRQASGGPVAAVERAARAPASQSVTRRQTANVLVRSRVVVSSSSCRVVSCRIVSPVFGISFWNHFVRIRFFRFAVMFSPTPSSISRTVQYRKVSRFSLYLLVPLLHSSAHLNPFWPLRRHLHLDPVTTVRSSIRRFFQSDPKTKVIVFRWSFRLFRVCHVFIYLCSIRLYVFFRTTNLSSWSGAPFHTWVFSGRVQCSFVVSRSFDLAVCDVRCSFIQLLFVICMNPS